MAAGQAATPATAAKLERYWTVGEGGKIKIKWGSSGDFDRCVNHLGKFVSDPKGLCAKYHHIATGMWPATHAKLERESKGKR